MQYTVNKARKWNSSSSAPSQPEASSLTLPIRMHTLSAEEFSRKFHPTSRPLRPPLRGQRHIPCPFPHWPVCSPENYSWRAREMSSVVRILPGACCLSRRSGRQCPWPHLHTLFGKEANQSSLFKGKSVPFTKLYRSPGLNWVRIQWRVANFVNSTMTSRNPEGTAFFPPWPEENVSAEFLLVPQMLKAERPFT